MSKEIKVLVGSTSQEVEGKIGMVKELLSCQLPESELLDNMGLFLTRQNLSRIMFMYELYQKIVPIHGSVFEFGVRWGQNLSLFTNFRGMLEPYNFNRLIVGFDTFEGFPSVDLKDGPLVKSGDYAVKENWNEKLSSILEFHQSNAPIPHKKKYELVKGDATLTLKKYLAERPETIISLAYFDFDIYHPTKACLELILPHMPKGSIIAFDELNCREFPGETIALKEVLNLNEHKLCRDVNNPLISYIVI